MAVAEYESSPSTGSRKSSPTTGNLKWTPGTSITLRCSSPSMALRYSSTDWSTELLYSSPYSSPQTTHPEMYVPVIFFSPFKLSSGRQEAYRRENLLEDSKVTI